MSLSKCNLSTTYIRVVDELDDRILRYNVYFFDYLKGLDIEFQFTSSGRQDDLYLTTRSECQYNRVSSFLFVFENLGLEVTEQPEPFNLEAF